LIGKKVEYFFTQKLPKTAAVKRKKDLLLECMLSDPRPHVTWFKNGEKIEVYYSLQALSLSLPPPLSLSMTCLYSSFAVVSVA